MTTPIYSVELTGTMTAEDDTALASVLGLAGLGVRIFDGSHIDVLDADPVLLRMFAQKYGGQLQQLSRVE